MNGFRGAFAKIVAPLALAAGVVLIDSRPTQAQQWAQPGRVITRPVPAPTYRPRVVRNVPVRPVNAYRHPVNHGVHHSWAQKNWPTGRDIAMYKPWLGY